MIWTEKPHYGLCFTEFYWTLFRDLKRQTNTCLISMTKAAPLPSAATETSQKHRNNNNEKSLLFYFIASYDADYLLIPPSTHCSHFFLLLGIFNQRFLTNLITVYTVFIRTCQKSMPMFNSFMNNH